MVNAVRQDNTPVVSTQTPAADQTSPSADAEANQVEENQYLKLIKRYFPKIVAISLVIQGLYALYQSIRFIFFDIPQMELLLEAHQISQQEINLLANQAILMIFSTILSMVFALRITVIQSKAVQWLDTIIGVLLVVANTQINNLLIRYGSTALFTTTLVNFLKSLFDFGQQVDTSIHETIPVEVPQLP